jgi:hypothetical protein
MDSHHQCWPDVVGQFVGQAVAQRVGGQHGFGRQQRVPVLTTPPLNAVHHVLAGGFEQPDQVAVPVWPEPHVRVHLQRVVLAAVQRLRQVPRPARAARLGRGDCEHAHVATQRSECGGGQVVTVAVAIAIAAQAGEPHTVVAVAVAVPVPTADCLALPDDADIDTGRNCSGPKNVPHGAAALAVAVARHAHEDCASVPVALCRQTKGTLAHRRDRKRQATQPAAWHG